ncbi:MAG: response regulator [Deltaproteobacteria bacterium]|jgi:response regulator of citrate/malate metabolism|nr:response regulator [Deltaproteobacteria bacterium]
MINAIVVEDDPMVAHINREYLQKVPNLKVGAVFGNGREALSYLLEHEVELVILDLYMPELSGIELLRQMRLRGLRADVIMVTAANETKQVEELLRLGVVDYLVKPFTEARFMEAMVRYLAKKRALKAGDELDQKRIDRLLAGALDSSPPMEFPKGLQETTWNLILSSLADKRGQYLGCDELAVKVELSKVTIRRYLKHMAVSKLVESRVDYETGGRPSVKYRLKNLGD